MERNRTNNHSEAFHRAVGRMIQIAHPQPFVMIRLLVQIEVDFRKKFEEQRLGKTVARKDRRLEELNRLVKNAIASFDDGMFDSDVDYLNAIAKLYVEYGHITKTQRARNSLKYIRHSNVLKQAVIRALEEQNTFALHDETSEEALSSAVDCFVETNYESEIAFDTQCEEVLSVCNEPNPSRDQSFCGVPHEPAEMQLASDRTHRRNPNMKEARAKKPTSVVSVSKQTRRCSKRRKPTLIQRMKMHK